MEFIIAVFMDLFFGEPFSWAHPVVYCGRIIGFLDEKMSRSILSGALCVIAVCTIGFSLSVGVYHTGVLMYLLVPYVLKSTFSVSSLYTHVKKCGTDDVSELRQAVSMIVSRDTSKLNSGELYSAAVESLAENFVDGVVSPIFYYLLFGLPGAVLCRCINTMDAMIGYRNEKYEKFGKVAARLDDIINFIPARLTVLFFMPLNPVRVLSFAVRYGGIKINGTWAIACMAGVLGRRLHKVGVYDIHPGFDYPTRQDVYRALKIYVFLAAEIIIISFVILFLCNNPEIVMNFGFEGFAVYFIKTQF